MPKKSRTKKVDTRKQELIAAFNALDEDGSSGSQNMEEELDVKENITNALISTIKKQLKKDYDPDIEARVIINSQRGDFEVYLMKEVVEEVDIPLIHISLEDARKIDEDFEIGDVYEEGPVKLEELLSRKSIQIIKQSVQKRIRDFEKSQLYEECKEMEGDIVTGEFYQATSREIIFTTYSSKKEMEVELSLPISEKIPREHFYPRKSVKLYVKDVKRLMVNTTLEDGSVVEKEKEDGPIKVTVSRIDNDLLKKLLEMEVPEVSEGLIVIKSVARVPGERAKVAVESTVGRIDPVGTCVGHRGSRIKGIVKELNNENIDVITFTDEIQVYIARALQPAKIDPMDIAVDFKTKHARVIVKNEQIKYTIGRGGNNIYLAEKLTGCEIEVIRFIDKDVGEEDQDDIDILAFREDFGDDIIYRLVDNGYDTAMKVLRASEDEILNALINKKDYTMSPLFRKRATNVTTEESKTYWSKIRANIRQVISKEVEAHQQDASEDDK